MSATTTTARLAVLPTQATAKPERRGLRNPRNLLRALVPVAVLVVWQLLSTLGAINHYLIPAPASVIAGFIELWSNGDLQEALPISLGRAFSGLAVGLAIGITAGVVSGLFRLGEELLDSSFQIVRVIPFIAMVPLFIVWFGIGEEYKFILIALACVFPAYLNTYSAVRHVEPRLIEAATVFGLGRVRTIVQVIIPAALPGILVGVRYSFGISLLALIVAEQTNSRAGIGYLIYLANTALRIDLIIVGILIYAILGVLVDVTMRFIERRSTPWL